MFFSFLIFGFDYKKKIIIIGFWGNPRILPPPEGMILHIYIYKPTT